METHTFNCNVCGSSSLEEVTEYRKLPRVSSDCKPLPSGGALWTCTDCGGIQKNATRAFLDDISQVYGNYDVYYQGGGLEQIVFDAASSTGTRRSELLSAWLVASNRLPARGKAIDLGCGNGVFLRSLSERLPEWNLYGLELDERHLPALKTIRGFSELLHSDVKEIVGEFDLITMIHALEHFLDPFQALLALRKNLRARGMIYIQVPNVQENPFDLLIADHVSHFSWNSLHAILVRAGYDVVNMSADLVKKELSVLAMPSSSPLTSAPKPYLPPSLARDRIKWFGTILESAKLAATTARRFALFGTSIAATWLSSVLGDQIEFYVDEDTSRQGRDFFGKPVFGIADAPRDATVFVGLAPVIANLLAERLRENGFKVVVPPTLTDP
jgi:SAM-dependent methyltransferase